MSFKRTAFVVTILLLTSAALLFSQAKPEQRRQPRIYRMPLSMTRLAYTSAQTVSVGGLGFPQVCFAVTEEGHYRMWRSTTAGRTETLVGTLTDLDRKQLRELIENSNQTDSNHLVRGLTNSFLVEIPNDTGVVRRSWVADRGNPFPEPVSKMVNWLEHFNTEKATRRDITKQEVCPAPRNWPVPEAPSSGR